MIVSNQVEKDNYKNIWVVAEVLAGEIQPVTYELIGTARRLADLRRFEVVTVVIGKDIKDSSKNLIAHGSDKVIISEDERFSGFIDELEAKILSRLIVKYLPEVVLCAATTRGRALIPRVAVMTTSGLTADCTGLDIDPENGDLLQTRPAFGGNIMATIRCTDHRPQMATVRPRVMKPIDPDESRTGEIIIEAVGANIDTKIKKVVEVFHNLESVVNLADAQIIISGGRGMKGPEGFELLKKFAAKVGGAVGASRAAVDAGWIPYAYQVGQTGQTVQTKVYIACGISGQIQHLVGMQSCDLIIAINKNPDTPIMQIADIAVVGDVFEIIPQMIEQITQL